MARTLRVDLGSLDQACARAQAGSQPRLLYRGLLGGRRAGAAGLLMASTLAGCDVGPLVQEPAVAVEPVDAMPLEITTRVPWLPGLRVVAEGKPSVAAGRRLRDLRGDVGDCQRGPGATLAVTAALTDDPGAETVLASLSRGVVVLDGGRHVVATAPVFPCGGSADELLGLALGDAGIGRPVLAVVYALGGHREVETVVELLGVRGEAVVSLFAGVVSSGTDRGALGTVELTADGLRHVEPDTGHETRWRYVPARDVFTAE